MATKTTTVAASTTSQPQAVGRGTYITVTPTSGGSASLEYTFSSAVDIANGVAVWRRWSQGFTRERTVYVVKRPSFVRLTSRTQPATLAIDEAAVDITSITEFAQSDDLGYVTAPSYRGSSGARLTSVVTKRIVSGFMSLAGAGGTYILLRNAPGEFDGVEVELHNDQASAVNVAVTCAALDAQANVLAAQTWATTQTKQIAAKSGELNGRTRYYFPVSSIPQTDSGYGPYVVFRLAAMSALSGGSVVAPLRMENVFGFPANANVAWATREVHNGYFIGSDLVTNPNSTPASTGAASNDNLPYLMSVTYYLRGQPLRQVVSFGHSQGLGPLEAAAGKWGSALARVCNEAGIPYWNECYGSQNSEQIYTRAMALLADDEFQPSTIVYFPYTNNDGAAPSAATVAVQKQRFLDVVAACERKGIEVIAVTGTPRTNSANTVATYTASEDAFRLEMNEFIRGGGNGRWKCMDWAKAVGNGAVPEMWVNNNCTLDGLHMIEGGVVRCLETTRVALGLA